MTKFGKQRDVLDEFHSYMGSGLSMDYHINGLPEKVFIEELAQRDKRHGEKTHRDMYQKYIKALCVQKKLLKTKEGRLFTYSLGQRKILQEKGLIPHDKKKTNWLALFAMVLFTLLVVYIGWFGFQLPAI